MTIMEHLMKGNPKSEKGDYWSPEAGYEDAFYDCKILVWEAVGDYFAMVQKDGKFGYVVIGFGSCSGCDALQDAFDSSGGGEDRIKKVADVLQSVRGGVHWESSKAEMRKYLAETVDKEIHGKYMSDDAERGKVWAALLAVVAE